MTDVKWTDRVTVALKRLDKEFRENELAYLALTSKAERQIVDRLAFSLHRDYGSDGDASIAREFVVSRKRVDLAITHGRTPLFLLEAKAMQSYHANVPTGSFKYRDKIEHDREKLRGYAPETPPGPPERVVLLLTTHTCPSPDKKWDGIVKYAEKIRKGRPKNSDEMKKKLNELLPSGCFPIMGWGDISGGFAFDMKVTIHFRLIGLLAAAE